MNRPNVLLLAETVEPLKDTKPHSKSGFCMSHVLHDNNSPSCLMGWASWLAKRDDKARTTNPRGWLGLSHGQMLDLTCPYREEAHHSRLPGEPGHISARHAAAVLRHLAETGKVDWSIRPEAA